MCRKHSGIVQPSWLTNQEDASIPDRRVSIGTFVASRTDALGGMSEEVSADSRPTFDYKAVSPPRGHQPRSLLPPSLLDLSETDDGGPCIANDMSCQNAHTDIAAGCWLCKNELLDVLSLETVLHRPPTNKDRETCLCRLHENSCMIVERMTKADILPAGILSVEDVVAHAVCPQPPQQCYERTCTTYTNNLQEVSSDCTNMWHQWATVKEERLIRNKTVIIQRTMKTSIDGTAEQLCES